MANGYIGNLWESTKHNAEFLRAKYSWHQGQLLLFSYFNVLLFNPENDGCSLPSSADLGEREESYPPSVGGG